MKPQPSQDIALRRAAWALLLIPAWFAVWSGWDMWLTYSPTPFNDQWANVWWWREAPKSGWLNYLFSQHNEHRIFFPRLVFLADWKWFQGRDGLNIVVIGLIQLAGGAFFLKEAQARRAGALGLLGLTVALGLIFSLMQWENLFWGFQVQFVGVYAAAAWGLDLFCRGAGEPGRTRWGLMAGALALLVLATFNMANGVFAGAAMVGVGLLTRRSRAAILVTAVATIALLAVYLHGYHSVPYHSPPSLALRHPARYLFYLAAYLGNIWAPGKPGAAALLGLAGEASVLGMLATMARAGERDGARSALLGVALFVAFSAAVTSLGRLVFGVDQALASRYMTPTAYFWAAQALFWTLTVERAGSGWLTLQRSPVAWTITLRRNRAALAQAVLLGLLALFLARLVMLQRIGDAQLLGTRQGIQLASSALVGGIDDDDALSGVYPDPAFIRDLLPFMRQTHVTIFADPAPATAGAPFRRAIGPKDACRGAFDSLTPAQKGNAWRSTGWGWDLKGRRAPADVVLVDDTGRVLGIGLSGLEREDVKKAVRQVTSRTSGWIGSINRGAGHEVIAYGLTAQGPACELGRMAWPH